MMIILHLIFPFKSNIFNRLQKSDDTFSLVKLYISQIRKKGYEKYASRLLVDPCGKLLEFRYMTILKSFGTSKLCARHASSDSVEKYRSHHVAYFSNI